MKEIEKLQHDRPCPSSWPFAHRITFPLIDFFFRPSPSLAPFPGPIFTLSHFVPTFSPFSTGETRNEEKTSGKRLRATSTPRNNLRSVGHQINNVVRLSLSMNFLLPLFFLLFQLKSPLFHEEKNFYCRVYRPPSRLPNFQHLLHGI